MNLCSWTFFSLFLGTIFCDCFHFRVFPIDLTTSRVKSIKFTYISFASLLILTFFFSLLLHLNEKCHRNYLVKCKRDEFTWNYFSFVILNMKPYKFCCCIENVHKSKSSQLFHRVSSVNVSFKVWESIVAKYLKIMSTSDGKSNWNGLKFKLFTKIELKDSKTSF